MKRLASATQKAGEVRGNEGSGARAGERRGAVGTRGRESREAAR